jgi:integrase/recombinase XerD
LNLLEAWPLYARDKKLLNYSKHTLKAYAIQIKLLVRGIGNIELNDVTREILKNYLAAQEHLKPASIGHRIRFIRSFFRWAVDEGYVSKNPAAKLYEPKQVTRIPKFLNEEDTETLREACASPLEHAIVEFMYTTGCRIGEIIRINIADIDWDKRSIIVNGKGSKEREIYFNMKCRIWLKKYLQTRKDNDQALFVTERAPHRMGIAEMRYIVKRVAKRSGLGVNVYPHRMRHSFATHLLNNGAPLEAIQQLLGHAKAETTALYANLSGERRREIYKRYF